MAKQQFQTEVSDLLSLMIHSLYSNKEIFLRELISNASDALDKLHYLTLTGEKYKNIAFSPRIEIKIGDGTLTITDNGIGMDEAELAQNLGTIARSGTKGFAAQLSGDTKKDSSLIGQFGVGFYSAFMVAKKIEVKSRKALNNSTFIWSSDTDGFTIEPSSDNLSEQGTQITLFLNDDEFSQYYRLEGIIKKYSNHIPYPIFMARPADSGAAKTDGADAQKEAADGESTESKAAADAQNAPTQINHASALWQLPKSQLKQSDYDDFYSQISHDSTAPLLHIHSKIEGTHEYSTLFYIPSNAPFDLFRVDYQSGVKLYVKRVFITDDAKELLPPFLRFVRGVIDVEDLPLNVSREILQENRILASVKDASVKKILGELAKLAASDSAKYEKFYSLFGRVLKEGLYGFTPHKNEILKLCRFTSMLKNAPISLDDYKAAMKEGQKEIYYISGASEQILKSSPLLEGLKKDGIDALICGEDIDTIVMPMAGEYDGLAIKSVSLLENSEQNAPQSTPELDKIIVKFKEILKDEAKDVRLSARLQDSPACIVYDKDEPDFAMRQIFEQMGQTMPKTLPILELNPAHELLSKLAQNELMMDDAAHLLLDTAKLQAGLNIDDPAAFAKRLTKMALRAI